MRPRESLLLLGLLTAVCLLAGVIFGIATGSTVARGMSDDGTRTPPQPSPLPGALPSATPGVQKSLLLIVLDDAEAPTPKLEGCWVISFRSGIPEYYSFGFAPSSTFSLPSVASAQTLNEIFAEDRRQQLGYRFLRDAVEARFPGLAIKVDVVLDHDDIARLVTELGGLALSGQQIASRSAMLDAYRAHSGSDDDALTFQGQVLDAVYGRLAAQGWNAGRLVDFLAQVPRIGSDSRKLDALRQAAADAPPLGEASLTWRTFDARSPATYPTP